MDRLLHVSRGGQVRLSNPDIAECKNNAEKYGANFDTYLESYLAIPLFSEDKLNSALELLSVIANTISNLALSGELAKSKATELVHLNDLLEKEIMRKTDELRASEERYRSIFDNALDIIYTLDPTGNVVNVNDVAGKLLGYDKDEIIGRHFQEFIHQDDAQVVKSSFLDLKEGTRDRTTGLKFRLKSASGKSIHFELNSRATYDEDGDLVNIDGILRNIDQALKTEQDLRTTKEKYKELFESMRDGVYMTDEAGYLRVLNKGALRILGYNNLSEIIGRPVTDIYAVPNDRAIFLKELAKEGFVEDYVVELKKKDGTSIFVEATSNELREEDGSLKGVEGVFRDATEKVKLRQENEFMRRYMENMIEHAGYGIIGVDLNRKVFVWNKGAEELFGYKADEAIGRDVAAIVPRDWREHRSNLVKRVKKGEVVRGVRAQRVTKAGDLVDISLTLSPVKNPAGEVVGISAIAAKSDSKEQGAMPAGRQAESR